jgi:hypothetical protein
MARFTAEGPLSYEKACVLISDLKKNGIDANITAGGVSLYPEPEQIESAQEICKRHGAGFYPGFSSAQEGVMLKSDDGWKVAEKVTNDARALRNEWVVEGGDE